MKRLFIHEQLTKMFKGKGTERGALFYIDMGRIQVINDIYGYEFSRQIVQKAVNRLENCRVDKSNNRISQIADNGFLIFYSDVVAEGEIYEIANEILEEFDTPIIHRDNKLYMGINIGIALYPEHGSNLDDLIENASIALNLAKDRGKNSFQIYSHDMSRNISEIATLRRDLGKGIKENQFILHYHPQLDLASKEIISLEVLIRWNHPQRGLIYPDDFIPIAEESLLIIPMGDFALKTACQQLNQWHSEGCSKCGISVNISPIQLQQNHIVDSIKDILKETGLDPSYIELEITEHSLIRHMEQAIDTLDELHSMGIKISLDDFGTGYSSLNYLKNLPVDIIKIDKTFINNIEDPVDRSIIKAIISMGHDIGLCITAEGVETEQQLEILSDLGCDRVQGFLFSKPLPSSKVEKNIVRMDQQMRSL